MLTQSGYVIAWSAPSLRALARECKSLRVRTMHARPFGATRHEAATRIDRP